MTVLSNPPRWFRLSAVAALLALAVITLPELGRALLRTNGYAPHGVCILWEPQLLWLHAATDVLIGIAYVAIGVTLAYLVLRGRSDLPFTWVWLAFGAFIISCGSTHFMSAWTFWNPLYWLSGATKVVTAVASVATAVALPPLVPRVLELLEAARLSAERKQQLEAANTELQTLNARLAELDAQKQRMFANVSHELRTPLTLILGPAEQLLEEVEPPQRRWAAIIKQNAQLLQRYVDDLLSVARLEAGQLQLRLAACDLAPLLRRTAEQFAGAAADKGITLEVATPQALLIRADEALLQRVLINLLSNALTHTPPGGQIQARARAQEDTVALVVEDSGPGVPEGQRERIFERFQQGDGSSTRRTGGIGLGLAIVREVVELHAGTVTVGDSALGGARFTVTLPIGLIAPVTTLPEPIAVREPTTSLPAPDPAPARESLPGLTETAEDRPLILIVEDNPELREFLAATLMHDYRLVLAADGQEGLRRAEAQQPDLIVSDVMMPELDGEALVSALQEREGLRETPLVILTARADLELRVRLLQGGASDYVLKPFSAAELKARIANLLSANRARRTLQRTLASSQHDLNILSRELARLYEQVQQALRVRDEFTLIAAHELRTPVTVLLGNTQLLVRRWERGAVEPTRDLRAVRALGEVSQRLARLVEALVDLTRIAQEELTLELTPVDVGALVTRQGQQFAAATERHRVQLDVPAAPVVVQGDERRLEQVIASVLDNAIKYSPDGGPIAISIQARDGDALITVSDEGMGIPEEALPYIFDRFYRSPTVDARKISGFGIGLYLARELITRHGGTIAVASSEGQGTRVIIRLPLNAGI